MFTTSDASASRAAAASSNIVLRRVLRAAWPSLPALLVASAVLCAAATVPVLVAPGPNAIAILLYATIATPPLAALAGVGNAAVFDEPSTIRNWALILRTHAGFALRHGLLVSIPAELFLAALQVWLRIRSAWLLPSLVTTGVGTTLAVLGFCAVVPLGLARPGLRGKRLWITGLYVVACRPSRFLAVFCLVGVGIWAALAWSASALLLIPGPAALVTTAAVWTTVAETVGLSNIEEMG